MPKPIFTKGVDTFTWSCYPLYPEDAPVQVNVVVDYSEGGKLYAYDKGIGEQFFNLAFQHANATDYSNFENWLDTIAKGPLNTFTYTDRASASHTVRLMDVKNPLRKVGPNDYSGSITLRKEI